MVDPRHAYGSVTLTSRAGPVRLSRRPSGVDRRFAERLALGAE
ncbi:hypothetical protein [Actinoallomurus acaciae]|uniref:Uncharacterized protein n=1 Tax=Actinoallomurus acaciae TaxID=502577 RepID=A0ABV5YNB1_9ACTN